jgi:hypothetical protein
LYTIKKKQILKPTSKLKQKPEPINDILDKINKSFKVIPELRKIDLLNHI